jgi:two-component system cell cycle sensor histidine kinase/response regulator CckA
VKTILLVEDDSASLIALALLLRSRGYRVIESSDGEEAINVCLEHRGPIDLLLMDFELGGSNAGPQLAQWLLELSPEMQVLFLFNSPPDMLSDAGALPWGCAVLQEPFSPEELVRAVRETLSGIPLTAPGLGVPTSLTAPPRIPCK